MKKKDILEKNLDPGLIFHSPQTNFWNFVLWLNRSHGDLLKQNQERFNLQFCTQDNLFI